MKEFIFVNQIGYETSGKKLAFLDRDYYGEKDFTICTLDNQCVYTGKVCEAVNDDLTKQNISALDFSDFCESGTYKIRCGETDSYPFEIGKSLYDNLLCTENEDIKNVINIINDLKNYSKNMKIAAVDKTGKIKAKMVGVTSIVYRNQYNKEIEKITFSQPSTLHL